MDLNQIIKADLADLEKISKLAGNALEHIINIGERLQFAKPQVDDFKAWVERTHGIKYPQATRHIRIAIHKEQARRIIKQDGDISIRDLQKLLPRATEEPEETEADSAALAYTGTQPGARNADDWHTPSVFVEAARDVLGNIDLDPFSSVQANQTIGARHIFTPAEDGMNRDWSSATPTDRSSSVWMNPPYSRGASSKAVDKFLEEYDHGSFESAVVLMNSSTDTHWFHRLLRVASAVCFTEGRISFEDAGGKTSSSNTKGQVFFYFGKDVDKFKSVFSCHGAVLSTNNVGGAR